MKLGRFLLGVIGFLLIIRYFFIRIFSKISSINVSIDTLDLSKIFKSFYIFINNSSIFIKIYILIFIIIISIIIFNKLINLILLIFYNRKVVLFPSIVGFFSYYYYLPYIRLHNYLVGFIAYREFILNLAYFIKKN